MSRIRASTETSDPSPQASAEKAAQFERRAAALRANLKRRKAQLRERAADQSAAEPPVGNGEAS
jgi:uncharacterized small protein (DUF1192 family)